MSVAVALITACGVVLVGVGGFFLMVRPPLMAEDVEFMGTTVDGIDTALPGLARWLRRVFWVLGGFIVTSGLLVAYVALTGLRDGDSAALVVLGLAALTSVGWMTVVNFLLRSHFRWVLLARAGLWVTGLLLAVLAPGR